MNFTITGKDGALTTFKIENAVHAIEDMPFTGYMARAVGNDITGKCAKKSIGMLKEWAKSITSNTDNNGGAHETANNTECAPVAKAKSRVLVEAGSINIGDSIDGTTVTGLGKIFRANADTAAVHGISPAADYVQYAYFN